MNGRSSFARAGDDRGATLIEFAFVAPVMSLAILGFGNIAYEGYMQSVLTGAVQKAGRDSSIEGAASAENLAAIDAKVIGLVKTLNSKVVQVSPSDARKNYNNFMDVGGEAYNDDNNNKQYDAATECFWDVDQNGVYTADLSKSGQGGASDVTAYTITVTYPRPFPFAAFFGGTDDVTISSSTILKNQPYADQPSETTTKVCPT